MMTRFAVAALLLVAVPMTALTEDDPKTVIESLQGEWKMLTFNEDIRDNPKEELVGSKIVVSGEKMAIMYNKQSSKAAFTVDSKAKPPSIDIHPTDKGTKEQPTKGIYKLEKDTLTICFGTGGGERPKDFKKGEKVSLMSFERVKK